MATDIVLTRPPDPIRLDGPAAIIDFLRSVSPQGRIGNFALVPTAANQEPSVGLYLPDNTGRYVPNGMVNLESTGNKVTRMSGFGLPPAFFDRSNLPRSISATEVGR